ncbi:lauroyl acyltransferase [uncultured Ferrovibrio sp.]|jgi:Lauroyl/myristoyl acyltransferase|uniref:lysophospholipid acyltransferase family protein n=1 Tax=uncultured Ferrovibrio sp. TaxID=1576913 RepID=UPI00262B9E94|nr:lauroyl acyltransferase [uncultured Ferrovibrio sp.]
MFNRAEPHEYVAAFGARLGLALFRALSLDAASAVGGWIGRQLGPHLSVHEQAKTHLARAMPELDEAKRAAILRGMWDNLGRVLGEYAHLGDIDIGTPQRPGRIELVGGENLDFVRDSGKPAIFISAHYGNWELMSLVATQWGLPLIHVYRAANNPLTEEILQELRKPVGGEHIPKGVQAAREIIKALKRKQSIGMLVDQKLNTGIPVPFFGRDAMTSPAAAELALKSGCPIVPAYVERLDGARFRVTVEKPVYFERTGNHERDVYDATLWINQKIEGWIRARPDHWFWVHKRWPD